jgi:uncharacterized protein YjiS (DUF1127 family)
MERAMSMMSISLTAARSHHLPQLSELRAAFVEWRERVRSRRALSSLDDRELWDMGLTRIEADYEAHKPFWQG